MQTQFRKIMNRRKHNLKNESLGKNPAYEDIYRALKSPRSFDPFMGMQLGAVRLPPSFSFNTKNSKIERSPGDNPIARFMTKEWIFSINKPLLNSKPNLKQLIWWINHSCPTNSYNSSNTVIQSSRERLNKVGSSHEVDNRLLTKQLSSILSVNRPFCFEPIFTKVLVFSKY